MKKVLSILCCATLCLNLCRPSCADVEVSTTSETQVQDSQSKDSESQPKADSKVNWRLVKSLGELLAGALLVANVASKGFLDGILVVKITALADVFGAVAPLISYFLFMWHLCVPFYVVASYPKFIQSVNSGPIPNAEEIIVREKIAYLKSCGKVLGFCALLRLSLALGLKIGLQLL